MNEQAFDQGPENAGDDLLRIDPHVHTLASDGIDDVETMIGAAMAAGLDAIAVTDHERVDAAVAGQAMARYRGWPIEVIVGEEISTRGGHLVGLYLKERIRPWRSLKDSIARVHEQGGLAIIAHPLPPYPLCASERTIRKLMEEADPIFHPDGMEGFNPTTAGLALRRWSRRAPALADELGIAATGGSDAHRAENVGTTHTLVRRTGSVEASLRAALAERDTRWRGSEYSWRSQVGMFARQTRKNVAALSAEINGKIRRDGTGRDLGYPGGRSRPVAFDRAAAGLPPEEEM
ncbi:MAG: CehA/McbA family metallohydrolase [Candidatus Limnocylindrales bacterium]